MIEYPRFTQFPADWGVAPRDAVHLEVRTAAEPEDELWTSGQVAQWAGVSVGAVGHWASRGYLPCIRTPEGRLRFRRSDVERLLPRRDTVMTSKEVADYLGVSVRTVYKLTREGKLTPVPSSTRSRMYSRAEVEALGRGEQPKAGDADG